MSQHSMSQHSTTQHRIPEHSTGYRLEAAAQALLPQAFDATQQYLSSNDYHGLMLKNVHDKASPSCRQHQACAQPHQAGRSDAHRSGPQLAARFEVQLNFDKRSNLKRILLVLRSSFPTRTLTYAHACCMIEQIFSTSKRNVD